MAWGPNINSRRTFCGRACPRPFGFAPPPKKREHGCVSSAQSAVGVDLFLAELEETRSHSESFPEACFYGDRRMWRTRLRVFFFVVVSPWCVTSVRTLYLLLSLLPRLVEEVLCGIVRQLHWGSVTRSASSQPNRELKRCLLCVSSPGLHTAR